MIEPLCNAGFVAGTDTGGTSTAPDAKRLATEFAEQLQHKRDELLGLLTSVASSNEEGE